MIKIQKDMTKLLTLKFSWDGMKDNKQHNFSFWFFYLVTDGSGKPVVSALHSGSKGCWFKS